MNGTTTFSPAGSVSLYFPKRSRIPARACGMIRTVRARSTTTNSTIRTRSAYTTVIERFPSRWCGLRQDLAHGVDEGRCSADGEHLDGGAGWNGHGIVVRLGAPDLAADLHPAGLLGRQRLGHDALPADQLVVPGH